MNEITCDVINDLLPAYAEGEVSADSKALVEKHLAGCPDCAARLEKMKEPLIIPPETEQHIMERLKRKQRHRRIRNIAIIVLVFLMLIGLPTVSVCLDMSVHLNASDITVETTESGQTRLQLSGRARGGALYSIYTQDEDGNTTVYLSLSNTPRLAKLWSKVLYGENLYMRDSLLDVYNISWDLSNDMVTGVHFNYWSSVGFCDSVILSDSIVAVYYQPNIDLEIESFCDYMEELIDTVYNEASDSDTTWTEDQLDALIISRYTVPESDKRTLLWMK